MFPHHSTRLFKKEKCFISSHHNKKSRILSNHGEESRVVDNVSFWRRGENHEKKKVQSHHMIESSSSLVQQERGRGRKETLVKRLYKWLVIRRARPPLYLFRSSAEREKEEITPSNGGQTESPIIIFLSFQTLPLSSFSRPDRLRR